MSTTNPLSSDEPQAQLVPQTQAAPVTSPANETVEVAAQGRSDAPGSPPCSGQALDETAKREFLWHTHQYLGEYARFGDSKAAFVGAIASALLGALYSAKVHVPILQSSFHQWALWTWLAAIAGVFLVVPVVLAVWTVLPRLRSTQAKGFIYWDSIAAHGNVELLKTSFHSQSARTLNDHLLHHVFDISSKVLVPKYRAVSLCIIALCIGGIFAAAALVLQDLANKTPKSASAAAAATVIAPPCKSGAASCEPWERDWSKFNLKPGSVVTTQGTIEPPQSGSAPPAK
ncbi:MAG: DUF5706 domain-containing protein [Bryobacteraceae bacterium]|nr:DUF5706 domain-containing protein [Bryobacteraceae bacterium]